MLNAPFLLTVLLSSFSLFLLMHSTDIILFCVKLPVCMSTEVDGVMLNVGTSSTLISASKWYLE